MQAFVPRMLASGEPGIVINTSSPDGPIAPMPQAAVYAATKCAVTCLTECLAAQLAAEDAPVSAAVFYPSGGLLDTRHIAYEVDFSCPPVVNLQVVSNQAKVYMPSRPGICEPCYSYDSGAGGPGSSGRR